MPALGGVPAPGVPALGGGVETPLCQLLLWAVRILERMHSCFNFSFSNEQINDSFTKQISFPAPDVEIENRLHFGIESDDNMEVAWFEYNLWLEQLIEQRSLLKMGNLFI